MLFGNKIKQLRSEHGVLQRELATLLEIDMPMMCKIERGERRAKRNHVVLLADYFHVDENEMLALWLADKVLNSINDEDDGEIKEAALKIVQGTIS